jgi:hypothetical protein
MAASNQRRQALDNRAEIGGADQNAKRQQAPLARPAERTATVRERMARPALISIRSLTVAVR